MSQRLKNVLKVLVSTAAAVVLLFYVFRSIEWEAFWTKTKSTDYSWVIVSILLSLVAYVARAYRWNLLLMPIGYELKTSRTTMAVLAGYLANIALPRLGEIVRCGIIKKTDGVPVSVAFGSVIAERLLDLIALLILLLTSLFIEFDLLMKLFYEYIPPDFFSLRNIAIGLFGLLVFSLIAIFVVRHFSKSKKKDSLVSLFTEGLLSIRKVQNWKGFVLATIVLWLTYYLMSYVIVFSLPETAHLPLKVGLTLLVVGGIALSIPVQAGFGTYHAMIAGLLGLYGISSLNGIFLATLLHTSQLVAVALFGSISLLLVGSFKRKKNETSR